MDMEMHNLIKVVTFASMKILRSLQTVVEKSPFLDLRWSTKLHNIIIVAQMANITNFIDLHIPNKICSRNSCVRRQLISPILPPERALTTQSAIMYIFDIDSISQRSFFRKSEIILIKYLATPHGEVQFRF
jgi:hypothetical protein